MITLTIIMTWILRKISRTRLEMARVETFRRVVPKRLHEIENMYTY